MTILTVLEYPDPSLRIKTKPVAQVDAETQQQLRDMVETMYADHGGGLAANQVGINKRMFVMDSSENHDSPLYFVNPEIIETSGELLEEEGCLSFPGVSALVKRFNKVKVRALDLNGQLFEVEYEGNYNARCVQHETDHLNGVVFIDHLSTLKRSILEKKLKKLQKARM